MGWSELTHGPLFWLLLFCVFPLPGLLPLLAGASAGEASRRAWAWLQQRQGH